LFFCCWFSTMRMISNLNFERPITRNIGFKD
jgi:hypothetical protein